MYQVMPRYVPWGHKYIRVPRPPRITVVLRSRDLRLSHRTHGSRCCNKNHRFLATGLTLPNAEQYNEVEATLDPETYYGLIGE